MNSQLRGKNAGQIFISSPVSNGPRALRRKLRETGLAEGVPVYVDEVDDPKVVEGIDPLEIVDGLLERLRQSSRILFILGPPDHGTRISLPEGMTHVSYWELEMFFAAVSKKPAQVLVLDGFEPEPRLASVLQILRTVLPPSQWIQVTNEAKALEWFKGHLGRRLMPRSAFSLSKLTESLFLKKKQEIQFLGGRLHDPSVNSDRKLISRLLESPKTRDEERRLCRLWFAGRELMGTKIDDPEHAPFLPLWKDFFGQWSSAGSWYGLHSHIDLGCIAALNGSVHVAETARRLQRTSQREIFSRKTLAYPGGALASARYSMARKIHRWRVRKKILIQALTDIEQSLIEKVDSPANSLLIRGSIHRQMGRFSASIEDYEQAVRLLEASGATRRETAVAISELGFGYIFQGRWWKARSLLTEAEAMHPREGRVGFLIRIKRKSAIAHFITGSWRKALRLQQEVRSLRREFNVYDQK